MASSGYFIQPRHAFGILSDVTDNVHFTEDGVVVYPVGHTTVMHNIDSRSQKFIPGTPDSHSISSLTISPNRKLLAIAERAEKAIITVFDLTVMKKRKVLHATPEAGSGECVSLAFSPDGKLLVAQGGAPDYNMTLWLWEKARVASMIKTASTTSAQICQVSFSPGDSGTVCAVGNRLIRTFKSGDGLLKPLPQPLGKRDPQDYKCHAWLMEADKERLLVGTDAGEVLLVDGAELKACFNTEGGHAVTALVAYAKGFVAGQANGVIAIYERDEKEGFRRSRMFAIEGCSTSHVKSMTLSPSEDQLVLSLDNNQLFMLAFNNTEIMKQDENNFEPLSAPFHSRAVTGLSSCVRKPHIATCSLDKSVRIWNWQERTLEQVKYFQDEAHSVALHPSGFLLLVGFSDNLRLLTVLMDDLKPLREFGIKACRECRFSNGGGLFAAVNGNTISLFNTFTCENVGNLRGHSGKVRSIYWSSDDTRLVSAGMEGAVYEWRLKGLKREKESVHKGCNYCSVTASADNKTLYAVGNDLVLKEFEEVAGAGTQVTASLQMNVLMTQIAMPQMGKVLYGTTETGSVRMFKLPLPAAGSGVATADYQEFKSNCCAIGRMELLHDSSALFIGAEDGSVFLFDLKDKEIKTGTKREQEKLPYAEEVLVTKSDLEEKKQRTSELEQQVNELTMQNEYQLRIKEMDHHEQLKSLTDKFQQELEADRQKFEMLVQEKNEQEMEYEEQLKAFEAKSQQQLAALDTQYQQKIMAEVERYQQLMQEKELLNDRWDEQNALLVESHERVIQELTEEYEAKLQEEEERLKALQDEKATLDREFEEIKRQLEEDADREIEELKEKYEARLAAEKEIGLRLKGENGIMRKKFNQLQKDIEDQREEIRSLFDQKKELYQTISLLEKDISGLKKEIRERDETIGDKEKRIYDLKKKNQELEKFKFVLDYKIKELKKQIEPREQEIADMKEQIKEMDHELERYHKTNANLDLVITDLRLKEQGLKAEVAGQRTEKNAAKSVVKRFQRDLHELVQHIQQPRTLKERVKQLFHDHSSANVPTGEVADDLQEEYSRQREYLEKMVDTLKGKLDKDTELHRSDNLRIMRENVALIKEINELRREMKTLKASVRPVLGKATSPDSGAQWQREVEMQRALIEELRGEVSNRDAKIQQLEGEVMPRPMSRERLPPMDGFSG